MLRVTTGTSRPQELPESNSNQSFYQPDGSPCSYYAHTRQNVTMQRAVEKAMSNRPPQPTPDLPQEPRWDAFKSTTIESMSASEQSRDFIERSDLFTLFLFTFHLFTFVLHAGEPCSSRSSPSPSPPWSSSWPRRRPRAPSSSWLLKQTQTLSKHPMI